MVQLGGRALVEWSAYPFRGPGGHRIAVELSGFRRRDPMQGGMRQLSSGRGLLSTVVLLSMLVSTGCSVSGRTVAAERPLVQVGERDFHITVTPNHVHPGDVLLVVRNHGPDTHELILVRSRTRLPLRLDGLTVDEQALRALTVASVDGAGPGSASRLSIRLAAGRYELFCNMAGHFMAGMHAELVVG